MGGEKVQEGRGKLGREGDILRRVSNNSGARKSAGRPTLGVKGMRQLAEVRPCRPPQQGREERACPSLRQGLGREGVRL